jgi:hypothetical protein
VLANHFLAIFIAKQLEQYVYTRFRKDVNRIDKICHGFINLREIDAKNAILVMQLTG